MADLKISQLGSIVTVVPATDVLPVVQGATTYKVTPNQLLGAGGVATLASATITGDLTVRTNKLAVTSTGVGIGTITPNAAYILDLTTSNDARARQWIAHTSFLGSGNLANGYQIRTLGDSTDGIKISNYANNAEYLRLNSSGNVVLSGGTTTANGVGITFPATQSASSDANCLDDYEEGTWDASFGTGGGTVTINTAYNRCRYTKIGRLVTVNGFIQVSSVSSPTGVLIITGLPFAIPSTTEGDAYSAVSVFPDNLEVTGTGQIVGFGLPSSSGIYLYRYQAGVSIGLAPSTKAGSEFTFTLTYSV